MTVSTGIILFWWHMGKNLKKLKTRKIKKMWYLCQIRSNLKLITPQIVKFDFRIILFSLFFQFQNCFKRKKLFLPFCVNFAQKIGKNQGKIIFLKRLKLWRKYIFEIKTCLPLFICPIRFIKLSSKLVFLHWKCLFCLPQKKR